MRGIGVVSIMGAGIAAEAMSLASHHLGAVSILGAGDGGQVMGLGWPQSAPIVYELTPRANNGKRHGTPREFRPTGTKRQRQRRRMI